MSRWISLKRRQLVQQVNALASTILMRSFSGGVESCFLKNSTDLKDVLMCCKLKIHKSQMIADRHAKNQNVCWRETETLDIKSLVVQETKCDIRVGQERAGGSANRWGVNPGKHSCNYSSLDQFDNFSNISHFGSLPLSWSTSECRTAYQV